MYVCVCVHACVDTHTSASVLLKCVCRFVAVLVLACMCGYVRVRACTCIRVCLGNCVRVHLFALYSGVYVSVLACTVDCLSVHVHMYICKRTIVHVFFSLHVCVCLFNHVCVYISVCV